LATATGVIRGNPFRHDGLLCHRSRERTAKSGRWARGARHRDETPAASMYQDAIPFLVTGGRDVSRA